MPSYKLVAYFLSGMLTGPSFHRWNSGVERDPAKSYRNSRELEKTRRVFPMWGDWRWKIWRT